MNGPIPPPFTGDAAALPPLPRIDAGPPLRLMRLLTGLALAVATFDACFWKVEGLGFSLALFFFLAAGVILANREAVRWTRTTLLLLTFLAGAALAAAIETGFTNTVVLLVLLVALAGDTFYGEVESAWGRWLSQGVALVRAPGRLFWLAGVLLEAAFSEGLGWTGGLIGSVLMAVPAVVLALIFGSLLASGNAVFGSWTSSFFDALWKQLALYLDPGRLFLWCVIAFLALPLLQPVGVSAWWWSWTQRLPRLPEMVPARAAAWSSGLVLVVLNLLFVVANIADALFLWSGQALPPGVTYSGFVHHGVNSLTVTVILSAFVLTTIFQQALSVARRRELKALALVWIAQNLFLLLSVVLRLKLYIEAYDMTISRLGVVIFLALVGLGYVLLTIKIVRDKSLSWLVGGCVLAVFATFYVTQFLDLAGYTANYNVARYEEKPSRNLDVAYLVQLGPPAWPALTRAHDLLPNDANLAEQWHGAQSNEALHPRAAFDGLHWREFSLRAWMNRAALGAKPNN